MARLDGAECKRRPWRRQITVPLSAEGAAAVCTTENLDLMRALGADAVIDYTQADFTRNGESYDVILDAVGKTSYLCARRSLAPQGRFVPTDGLHNVPLSFATRWLGERGSWA
jgi:NADPH:quinone reductase-like Zn-dependent oxidoreductase